MAYTIIVGSDNTLYGSHKEKIIQREKLFNKLWFLVAPHYNGYDMSECTVTLRYLLPISKEFKTETLVLSKERYREYLKYIMPVDTNLTKEHGDIEFNLTFTMLGVDDDGNVTQHVRKTTNGVLTVYPIPDWDSIIPDNALAALDRRILQQDAQIKTLENLANVLNSSKADSLVYNDNDETLQLASNGIGIGNKVNVRDMLDDGIPVVDLDKPIDEEDDGDNNHDDGCNCGCENNVVEFGYLIEDNNNSNTNANDGNVVEF